jgi:surfeit locus 1 family protein
LAPTDPEPAPGDNRLDAWFRVDIERIQQQIGYPLLPIFIDQSPNPEATSPPLREDDIDLSDGPHLGYALQWFSFAVILIVLYAIFIRQELKGKIGE